MKLKEMTGSTKTALGVILVLAALLRIFTALTCEADTNFSDMAIYNEAALAGGFPSYPPPGYPLFLRAVYSVFGALNFKAVYVVQSLFSIAAVLLIFLSARNVFNEKAGLFAAGIAAIYPKFIVYNLITLTESLGVFLVALMIWFMTSHIRESVKSILSGALIFIGFLIKPAFLFFIPGVFAASRKRVALLLTLGAVFGSFFLYGIISGESEKRGAMMLYKAYNPLAVKSMNFRMEDTELGAGGDVSDEEYLSAVRSFVTSNKWMTLEIIYNKSSILVSRGWTRFGLQDIVGKNWVLIQIMMYCYLPVLFLGLTGMLRYPNPGTRKITLTLFSYLVFHILITIFKQRYRLTVEPALVVLAGMPLAAIPLGRVWSGFDWRGHISSLGRRAASVADAALRSVREGGKVLAQELRRDLDLLLVLLFLALALRIYISFAVDVQQLPQESLLLNNLALTGGMSATDAPLYPLFLRAVYSIFGDNNFTAVFMIQGLLDAAGVAMLYIAVSRIWTRRAGILAAALASIYPRFLSYCITVKTQSIGIFLVITLLLISRSSIPKRARGVSSGIVVGLAIMLEPLYLFLVPGTFAVLRNSRRAFLLTLIVILAPLAIRNSSMERQIIPVYSPAAYGVDLRKFKVPDSPRLLNALYMNASAILGRDWRDSYGPGMDPRVRNFYHINTFSYIVLMLLGMAGLIKYLRREHLIATLPVLGYIVLLIFFTQLNNKVWARALWEPVLIAYGAILMSRQRPDGSTSARI